MGRAPDPAHLLHRPKRQGDRRDAGRRGSAALPQEARAGRMRRLAPLVAAALLLAPAAAASEQHPTLNELENEVMCPVCGTTLAQSNSPAAEQIKQFIRTAIARGDTKSEIKTDLVRNYGEAILAAPPKHGF